MNVFFPLLLSACSATLDGGATDGQPADLVLATYDVPVGYESRTEDILNRAFWRGQDIPAFGRALQGPTGSVVVAAPRSAHADVRSVIARLSQLDPKIAEPQNVRLSYWMIGGKKATSVDVTSLPPAITTAMTEVAASELPMRYEVVFHESLLSLDGSPARGGDAFYTVEQVASLTAKGAVLADIEINARGGIGTKTRVQIVPGQVLVMGQTTGGGDPEDPAPTHDALFYVVRPERVAAQ